MLKKKRKKSSHKKHIKKLSEFLWRKAKAFKGSE